MLSAAKRALPHIMSQNLGVGIGLHMNCAVIASLTDHDGGHNSTGVFTEIAKIEGSDDYKRLWRLPRVAADWVNLNPSANDSHRYLERDEYPSRPAEADGGFGYPLLSQNEVDAMRHDQSLVDASADPMVTTIRQLKAAAVEKLGVQPVYCEIVDPFPLSPEFKTRIYRALMANGMNSYYNLPKLAGLRLATRHLTKCSTCTLGQKASNRQGWINSRDDPEYMIEPTRAFLIVDYSSAACTAFLTTTRCGWERARRVFHDFRLGGDAFAQISGQEKEDRFQDLVRAIRRITEGPFKPDKEDLHCPQNPEEETNEIAQIIVVGEECDNATLRDALAVVFPGRDVDGIDEASKKDALFYPAKMFGESGYLWRVWDNR